MKARLAAFLVVLSMIGAAHEAAAITGNTPPAEALTINNGGSPNFTQGATGCTSTSLSFNTNSFVTCNSGAWAVQPVQIGTSASAPFTCSSTYAGMMYENSGTNTIQYCNGTTWTSISGGGSLSGSGSTGYDSIWTSATTIGTGLLYESGGNVGIGTASPNTSALLQLYSTTEGFLPPLLTTANETSMGTSLPAGLLVYNTTNNELESFNGTNWEAVGANAADAAGSTGQVQFNNAGDLGADSNFFWDNTNKRLGIGSTLPGARTEIDTGATGTVGLLIKGVSGQTANFLNITDNFGNLALTVGTTQIVGHVPIVATDFGIHSGVFYDLKNVGNDLEILNGSNGSIPFYATGAGNVGIGISTPASLLNLGGNISASSWTTTGIDFATNAATYTDTSTAAAGTVTTRAVNSHGLPTLASTNAITVTNGSNLYIAGGAVKGTNTTLTNSYGEYIDAGAVGAATNSYGLYVNAQTGATNNYGAVIATGNVGIGTTSPSTALQVVGTVTATTFTGAVGVTDLNSGTGASSSTFWRGDGTWAAATPSFSGLTSTDFCTASGTTAIVCNTGFTGTGSVVLAASPTLTGTITAATVNLSGVETITAAPAANTSADGLILTDTTAASSGNQQYSPRLHFTGRGWKTTATAASEAVDFIEEVQPVQGTTAPSGNLVWSSQINGTGGYSPLMTLTSGGNVGIGTTLPTAALSIQTPSSSTSGIVITDSANQTAPNLQLMRVDALKMLELKRGAGSFAGQLSLYDTSGNETKLTAAGALYIDTGQTAAIRLLPSGSDIFFQNTTTSGNIWLEGNAGAELTGNILLYTSGNVGIGTTSPVGTLNVYSTVARDDGWHSALEITSAGSNNFPSIFFSGQTSSTNYSAIVWTASTSGNNLNKIGATIAALPASSTDTDLQFYTNNVVGSATATEKMRILGNGNVGIGITTPVVALDVYNGDIRHGNTQLHSLTRALPTTAGNYIEIGNFAFSNGGGSLWVSVTVPSSSYSVAKEYLIPIQYNETNNVWQTVQPLSSTGAFSPNDFALDINVNAATAYLRLRDVTGTTAGTAYVTIRQEGINTDTFTATSATGTNTPTALFSSTPLTQVSGNVGIGTTSPSTALQVVGTVTATTLTGAVGVTDLNSGTAASSSTFWRGDGTWAAATPSFSGLTSTDFCTASGTTAIVCNTGFTGTGSVVLAASPTLTGTITAATVNLSGVETITAAPAANTSADGLILTDTTAASSGNQQFSPRLHFTGRGWKTTATAASQAVDFIQEVQPVQGTTAPSGNLVWSSQINGTGGYSPLMTLTSGGNIGIGTTSPTSVLHIYSNGTVPLRLDTSVTAGHANYLDFDFQGAEKGYLGFGASSTDFYVSNVQNGNLIFYTNNAEYMRINSSGNVGIGTAAPYSAVDAYGVQASNLNTANTSTGVGNFTNTTNNVDTTSAQTVLTLGRNGKTGSSWGNEANFNLSRYSQSGTAANTQLDIKLNNGATGTPDTNVMSLLASGNVGIGTTAPNGLLNIYNSAASNNLTLTGASNSSNLISFRTTAAPSTDQWVMFLNGSDLRFWDTTDRLTLQHGGNVGIGTTSPSTALQVVGTVTATTFTGAVGVTDLNSGTGASSSTFWRGDGTWAAATPSFSGLTSTDFCTASGTTAIVCNTGFTGTGSVVLAASPTLTGTITAATVNLSGVETITAAPAANTSTDGLILTDTTAASSGNQQYSPRLHFTGRGWKTTATAASEAVDFIQEVQPVQGTTAPSGNLVWSSQINGTGGYSPLMTLTSGGSVGIGTTLPASKLDVQGTSAGAQLDLLRLLNAGAGNNTAPALGFSFGGTTTSQAFISAPYLDNTRTTSLQFGTGGGGTSANAEGTVNMTITGQGNVGIGTASPANLLTLYGTTNNGTLLTCIIQPGAPRFAKMQVERYVVVLLLSAGHASASPVVDQRWDLHLFVG